jgi:heme O synthase-like polyprenyltransferase
VKDRPLPKRPFRDSAILYASMAVVFVVVSVLTGRPIVVAVLVAAGCFVLATAYSWWRWSRRLEQEQERR